MLILLKGKQKKKEVIDIRPISSVIEFNHL